MNPETILKSLEELRPKIRARRAEIETARRLPPDLVDDLRRAGAFALEIPRALGGAEAEPLQILEAIESVAQADGSTGWCVMVANANNTASGFTSEAGAREVFADPTIPAAGAFAPTGTATQVDGGFRVSGRWQFSSGITHSPWVWAGFVVTGNGQPRMTANGPDVLHGWMRTSEVEIHDTWFVSGLSGTGSNDISAREVFIPDRRAFRIMDPSGHRREPLYRMPPVGWFVSHVAAVALGIARAALDELAAAAQAKVPTFSAAVLADRAAAQIGVAQAEAQLAAARAFLWDAVGGVWRTIVEGGQPTARQIAFNRAACTHAAETAATVTARVGVLAGGSAIYATSSLQRHVRDADAVAHHFTVSPHTWEDAGRVFLGRSPLAPMF